MKQPIFTPPIQPCAICGAQAKTIDWNYNGRWVVMCDNNHTHWHIDGGGCTSRHRAICRWNNKQIKAKKDSNHVKSN